MADVLPFAGTRFNVREKQLDLGQLLCPPAETIPAELRDQLHQRSEFNLVRIISGKESASDDDACNRFTRAAECYREWKAKNILVDEQRKCFYVYEQEWKPAGARKTIRRRGFIALVKLQDYRSGKIRSHEATLPSLRSQQQRLLKAVQVNLTPPFILYQDPEHQIDRILEDAINGKTKEPVVAEGKDLDGVTHRLWMIHRKEPILAIHEAMKPKRLFIADGNHLYDAALSYRDEMREATGRRDGRQPYDLMMMYLHNASDESLQLDPVHRILARELGVDVDVNEVIEDLREFFTVTPFKVDMDSLEKASAAIGEKLENSRSSQARFAMILPNGKGFVLTLRKDANVSDMIDEETMSDDLKSLDVTLLHHYVITRGWIGNPEVELGEDDLFYSKTVVGALEMLRKRKGSVAFILNPHTMEGVLKVAENGELMPPQSTFLSPKPACGLVLRDHNVGFG